jgi:integrase
MPRGKRTRIALGIYRDRSGFSVCWREGGKPKEVRFDLDTPLYRLRDYRREQVNRVAEQPKVDTRHGLARDVVRYLRVRKDRPGFKAERSHLRAWLRRFPKKSRWALTKEDCALAVSEWRQAGVSQQTVRHRVMTFLRVYRFLDGKHVRTPLDEIDAPKPPKRRPRSVTTDVLRAIAERLMQQELHDGRMTSPKTRARFLVLATTGQRPCQLQRATAQDVDLEQRIWYVDPAKGDRGTIVVLNEDMLAAWKLFIQANAWGDYSASAFARCLRRHGWPEGIRPYNLRHSVGLTLSELGVDLGDISAHMGHSSIDVTRQFYVPALLSRLREASTRLDGRLSGLADVPSRSSITEANTESQNAQKPRKTRKSRVARSNGTTAAKEKRSA